MSDIYQRFVAYIDEAGDEGFNIVPPPGRKSSEWFVLSAIVCRAILVRTIEAQIARHPKMHFRKGEHHECIAWSEMVARMPITAISIISHKPSVPNQTALRDQSHYLFNYCTKLLVERISWVSRDKGAAGPTQIILSDRGQLRLQTIRDYMDRLKRSGRSSIDWSYVRSDLIDRGSPAKYPALRVADVVASGCARAIEYSPSQNTEHRFVKIMRPRFYRSRGRAISYGIKFFPDQVEIDEGTPSAARLYWLHHFR